ncbi:MAG: 23S rRNA pseudouridine(1911/1915/1917) synthase RluD [Arsenophonus sp.]
MSKKLKLKSKILKSQIGQRLDKALSKLFVDHSRSQIKEWILCNRVLVNGKVINAPKKKVFGNEQIYIDALIKEDVYLEAQNIPLNIIYEDEEILVINKPRNLVVHPGAGNPDGTLLNALLYHYPKIINVPRAGIVHRLDKDTTGLMVIAKTIRSHIYLIKAFRLRAITREYEAVINGHIIGCGIIDEPIARHPTKRTHMAVSKIGKPCITYYKIVNYFRHHTRLRLQLNSGRTHQIRVHMAYINHHLVGDQVYGGLLRELKDTSEEVRQIIKKFNRQALHSAMLRMHHPCTGIEMEWNADIPVDMIMLINILKIDAEINENNMDY